MPLIRTFVAIHLTREIVSTLRQAQAALRASPGGPAGRYVQPENIHLTLKFLGDVALDRLPAVYAAVAAVAQQAQPLALTLGVMGCFPKSRRPRVVWATIGDTDGRLALLAGEIDARLVTLGYARETRPFAAHLTLARVQERATLAQAAALGQVAKELGPLESEMVACDVAVVRSDLSPQGPRYTDLSLAPLGGATRH